MNKYLVKTRYTLEDTYVVEADNQKDAEKDEHRLNAINFTTEVVRGFRSHAKLMRPVK